MSEKYYQEYGPMSRRRGENTPEPNQPDERPPRDPRRTPRSRPRKRRSLFGPLFVVALMVGIGLALPYAANLLSGDQALAGVSIQGQPVGGMSRPAISTVVDQRYGAFARAPLTLTFGNKTWSPSLQQLGISLDTSATVEAALAAGRRGDPLERANELWSLWQHGVDVAPNMTINMAVMQAYLGTIANELEHPPRDAALSVAEGKLIPTDAQTGRQMLVDDTAREIVRTLQTLQSQQVPVRTRDLEPRIGNDQLAQAVKQAQTLLQAPVQLLQGDRNWVWKQDKIAEIMAITTSDGTLAVGIDQQRLAKSVEDLAQTVDSGSHEPRVAFRNGRLAISEEGRIGLKLQQDATVKTISDTLLLANRQIDLPVEQLTPKVTPETLASLGIVELVGEGRTSFAGSAPYRVTNIKAGAARMNGVLIEPDEEFSFNTQLGAVDENNGFVQGYAVIGNRTQLEWGGGVCQDSTTVFRAAFWAGLPITERHAHPFYISWYDDYSFPDNSAPGMDATIYTGVSDLKFLNDTGHWLLMEATVDEANQVLIVRLYGTKPNRTVTIDGPYIDNITSPPTEPVYTTDASLPKGTVKQTDTARKGMDIVVYRVITQDGVEQQPESFYTRFKAWPNVFVRGTG